MPKIEDTVKEVISEHLGVSLEDITERTLLSDLGADNLDTVELAMAFEEAFGIYIKDEYIDRIKTVENAIGLVYELS